jgi:hypothetical protein
MLFPSIDLSEIPINLDDCNYHFLVLHRGILHAGIGAFKLILTGNRSEHDAFQIVGLGHGQKDRVVACLSAFFNDLDSPACILRGRGQHSQE